jgi:bifunctional non-homologous end joining protein LigD
MTEDMARTLAEVEPPRRRRASSPRSSAGVTITHPEKVLFPAPPITKGELAAYYDAVAPALLPHLRGRPLTLERYPDGISTPGFIQKSVVRGVPPWLERITVPKEGGVVHHPSAADARALQWIANQNTIAIHVWPSRAPALSRPDLCVIDLDPPADEPARLRDVMLVLAEILTALRLSAWLKTSGSRGYHVVLPLGARSSFERSAALAERIAGRLVEARPVDVTREFRKKNRQGRIFIDTARNRMGATVVSVYSVRARPGAPVSAPCTWEEVASGAASPQAFTLRTLPARLAALGDLWADLHDL